MNGAHLHLIVNHVSFFALIMGAVTLGISMKRQSGDLRLFATVLFLIAGVFGWIAVETGEDAADIIKTMDEATKPFIKEHAGAAHWAQRSGFLVAAVALVMEWAVRKRHKWAKALQWVLLFFALHGCTVYARTAFLGGLIRHTEIRN